jgi:hypothetical protein
LNIDKLSNVLTAQTEEQCVVEFLLQIVNVGVNRIPFFIGANNAGDAVFGIIGNVFNINTQYSSLLIPKNACNKISEKASFELTFE